MSNVSDVMEGVQEALLEAGETGQIIKTVTTRDPTNPTKVIQTTKTYSARMYMNEPTTSFIAGGQVVQKVAQLYVDWLSLYDTDTETYPNTLTDIEANLDANTWPVVALETEEGDIAVRANGTRVTLLGNTGTNINGVTVCGIHEVSS